MLTARQPEAALTDLCDRYGIQLLRVRAATAPDEPTRASFTCRRPARPATYRWIEVRLAGGELSGPVQALLARPALSILVRPDRVIAAAADRRPLPGRAVAHQAARESTARSYRARQPSLPCRAGRQLILKISMPIAFSPRPFSL